MYTPTAPGKLMYLMSSRSSPLMASMDSKVKEPVSIWPPRKLANRVDSSRISCQIISANSGLLFQWSCTAWNRRSTPLVAEVSIQGPVPTDSRFACSVPLAS